jgi:catechol 2,3-dioxygenase-like lactoylglutathione lyase family enzyme
VTAARIGGASPFFIVSNVAQTIAFYRDKLGFEAHYLEPPDDPFFGAVHRDEAMIFLKAEKDVAPQPNSSRHPWIKWDAYVSVPDPDALAAEFAASGLTFHTPLGITSENLRGFDVRDPDGYVLFFGRPNQG